MLAELPTACDVGCKKNSKGYKETWNGYKLHLDVACGQIPVSCVLTSASVHDSQVAIPLMTMTSARIAYLYDLMDAAYDAAAIHDHGKALGHMPIIDRNFRAQHEAKAEWAREVERMKLVHMPDPDDIIFDFCTGSDKRLLRFAQIRRGGLPPLKTFSTCRAEAKHASLFRSTLLS
jgi:hypothetical protein